MTLKNSSYYFRDIKNLIDLNGKRFLRYKYVTCVSSLKKKKKKCDQCFDLIHTEQH